MSTSITPAKILGGKAYGSIGHLLGSRVGPADRHCHEGQARIATIRARDRRDRVIVQEKLDGSCVAVALSGGIVYPLGRAGWPAASSPYPQHRLFDAWARANEGRFRAVLRDGERLCGEWLAQAHGTRYELPHEPFVAFDVMDARGRLPFAEFVARCEAGGFMMPRLLHMGGPFSIPEAIEAIEDRAYHGAIDPVEGAVWRVERGGVVDFLAKWVRPDKVDGLYLPEISGMGPVWNWEPAGSEARP